MVEWPVFGGATSKCLHHLCLQPPTIHLKYFSGERTICYCKRYHTMYLIKKSWMSEIENNFHIKQICSISSWNRLAKCLISASTQPKTLVSLAKPEKDTQCTELEAKWTKVIRQAGQVRWVPISQHVSAHIQRQRQMNKDIPTEYLRSKHWSEVSQWVRKPRSLKIKGTQGSDQWQDEHIIIKFSWLELKVHLWCLGTNCVLCWRFSNISANTAVAIFRVNISGEELGSPHINLAVDA